MAEALVERTVVGKLRMVDAQVLAQRNAMQKGAPADVQDLASCGHSGQQTGHMERDMMLRYSRAFGRTIEPYTLWMDLHTNLDKFTFPTEVPFLFPTDMIAAIYDAGHVQLVRSI